MSAVDLAPQLLGKILCKGESCLLISEVEAYGGADDEASHAFKGVSPRNKAMFERGGRLYVYLSYGIHKCINVVAGPKGSGMAVLIRAGVPVEFGQDTLEVDVPRIIDGPGRVGRFFDATLDESGLDLLGSNGWRFVGAMGEMATVKRTIVSTRIGISKAVTNEWRFRIHLSGAHNMNLAERRINWTANHPEI